MRDRSISKIVSREGGRIGEMGERCAMWLDEAKMILAKEGLYGVGKQVLGRWKPREISATLARYSVFVSRQSLHA